MKIIISYSPKDIQEIPMPSPKSILHVIAVSIHLMKPAKGLMLNKNDTKPPVKKKKKTQKKSSVTSDNQLIWKWKELLPFCPAVPSSIFIVMRFQHVEHYEVCNAAFYVYSFSLHLFPLCCIVGFKNWQYLVCSVWFEYTEFCQFSLINTIDTYPLTISVQSGFGTQC